MCSYYDAMLDAIEQPKYILRGERGALIAVVPHYEGKKLVGIDILDLYGTFV
jgi:hypothetical protein